MIKRFDFLNQEQIDRTIATVFELKEHWINRGKQIAEIVEVPFYTLGAASYIDSAGFDQETYLEKALKYNPILSPNFLWLYTMLREFLSKELGCECKYYSKLAALPGFHIFLSDEIFTIPISSKHCDLQFKEIDWQDQVIEPDTTTSFTLYLELPKSGGGINFWDFYHQDLKNLAEAEKQKILLENDCNYIETKAGELIVHSGLHYHQIAAFREAEKDDKRISLQGHAIKAGDRYWIYW